MYRIIPDPDTMTQVAALPADALDAYAEALEDLQLAPWNGRPLHENNPEGAVRRWTFGSGQAGQVVYLILERPMDLYGRPARQLTPMVTRLSGR